VSFPIPPLNSPDKNSRVWHLWFDQLRRFLSDASGLIPWASINKSGSNLTDLTTRRHNDLQIIQGGAADNYYHLTAAQLVDLTDGNDSAAHFHSADRARANHTGTQVRNTISDFAHDHTTADGSGVLTNDEHDGFIEIATSTAPATPAAGKMRVYAQDAAGVARLRALHSTGSDLAFFRDSVVRVKNTSGGTINKGEIVYCTGATGNFPTVAKAKSNAAGTMPAIGMVLATAANNAFTTVQTAGEMTGLDTSAFAEGASLFVSATAAGAMTATEPQHPFLSQEVGFCTKSNAGGGAVQLFCTPAHEGDDFGSNRNTYKIGDGAAGTKTLGFSAAGLGSLQWAPTAARTVTIPDDSGTVVLSRVIGATWDNGSSAVVAADCKTVFVPVNAAGTINRVEIITDNSVDGSCVVDVWKANNAYPSVANTIISGTKPTISAGRFYSDTTLSGFSSLAITAGDRVAFHLDSASSLTTISIRMTFG